MNFYKHHIGDYASATDHLTWDEDQAYSRLLRVYYRDERPLPLEIGKVLRLARATSPTQKAAVETVLNEFFTEESDGWHNKRCDAEIAQATTQAETNRRIAADREAARLARIANGSLNGSSHASLNDSSTNGAKLVNGSKSVRQPIQTPDSRLHKPDSISQTRQEDSRAAAQPSSDPEFDHLKLIYPKRGGSQRWPDARKHINARLGEGHTWQQIFDGVQRYAAFIRATGKERTEHVQQAATFLGTNRSFLEAWDLPAGKADVRLATNLSAAEEFMRKTESVS